MVEWEASVVSRPFVVRTEMQKVKTKVFGFWFKTTFSEAVGHEPEISNKGGKSLILPKEINANRFFWDSLAGNLEKSLMSHYGI